MSDKYIADPQEPGPHNDCPDTPDDRIPAIPQWVKEWGFIPLTFVAFLLVSAIADIGRHYGPGTGWLAFSALLMAALFGWHHDYTRRQNAAAAAMREVLYRRSCLAAADAMDGHEFEAYYASLLTLLGWRGVQVVDWTGGGDGGADILATDPDGRPAAIQCKRWSLPRKVAIQEVRQLNGALVHEHPGRRGIVVTTALLTRPAEELAAKSQIEVIARPALADQMARGRLMIEQQDSTSEEAAPPPAGPSPETR